jgi:hypothetical protein
MLLAMRMSAFGGKAVKYERFHRLHVGTITGAGRVFLAREALTEAAAHI